MLIDISRRVAESASWVLANIQASSPPWGDLRCNDNIQAALIARLLRATAGLLNSPSPLGPNLCRLLRRRILDLENEAWASVDEALAFCFDAIPSDVNAGLDFGTIEDLLMPDTWQKLTSSTKVPILLYSLLVLYLICYIIGCRVPLSRKAYFTSISRFRRCGPRTGRV